MLYPILCHCGRSLGDLADCYKYLRWRKIQELIQRSDRNIAPSVLNMVDDLSPEMDDIFKQLKLDMECCRMKMMTTVEFWDLY
jgi:DNA-directed RNA polymerase subunit N (RpoN/RPB10)